MLGALPYVGLTLMSPFAGRVFAYWPAKRVVVISMALNAFATLLMVLTVLLPQEVLPLTSSGGIGSGENGSGFAGGAAPTDLAAAAATPAAEGAPGSMSAAAAEAAAAATSTRPFFRLPDFSFGDLTPCALLLLSSRLLVGLTQAPFVIFAPVWVDEFAPPKKAALWMGIMQGAAVVGVTVSCCGCCCFRCCCYFCCCLRGKKRGIRLPQTADWVYVARDYCVSLVWIPLLFAYLLLHTFAI